MKMTLSALLLVSVFFTGCQLGRPNETKQPARQGTQVQQVQRVPQTAKENEFNQSPVATASRLVEIADKVPNVQRSTAIVFGKTAVVGIDVNGKLDRARVGTIKYTVAQALKKDPQGASAIVTADPDIVQRVKEMNEEVRKGRPIAGFAQELADITGRLMPQLPKDISEKKINPADRIQIKGENPPNQ
ncbi:MAG TPA: YhcN/YlaJ family sporulation lipoprotein [Bacillota bacterium]|nr:YhcN/YlaJ family sporulation lipoprotein [Bacillota bacterium]